MAKYCASCGAPLAEGARFCGGCGAPLAAGGATAQRTGRHAAPRGAGAAGTGADRTGVPAPGFSDRVDHPEIRAAVAKNRRAAGCFAFFVVPLPLAGFATYAALTGEMGMGEALRVGAVVSLVFLAFALWSLVQARAARTYEAVVVGQWSEYVQRRGGADDDPSYEEVCVTLARTTRGRKKTIREREGSQRWAYEYLGVGDRFRYHPQFNFPYERYDKASAPYLACVSCTARNPVEADRCRRCGLPLLK